MLDLLLIVGLSLLGALGDVFLKMAGRTSPIRTDFLVLGAITYLLTVPGWFVVLERVRLSTVGAIYAISSVLILTLTGVLLFRERLSVTELVGIALAIAAVIALRRFA